MKRVAVFVDAGYVFAAGAMAIHGTNLKREMLKIDAERIVAMLLDFAASMSPGSDLLRLYWYDCSPDGARPMSNQMPFAEQDNVKVRLGFLGSEGKQKGVDTKIVADLISLSQQRVITDAVLVSGDEDLTVGVEFAQSLGVRMHLLGILHSNEHSQSMRLRTEADTTRLWNVEDVELFLSVVEEPVEEGVSDFFAAEPSAIPSYDAAIIAQEADRVAKSFNSTTLAKLAQKWESNPRDSVPPDHDRDLILSISQQLGRDLTGDEKKIMRSVFKESVGSLYADNK